MEDYLKEYQKQNIDNLDKSQDYFEKQLSFISSGALGISMFFIEKVVKDVHLSKHKFLIIGSWILFGITLITNLISHLLAVKFSYDNLDELDKDCYNQAISLKRNKITICVNLLTLISLIFGIFLLILFVSLNV